MIIIIEIPKDLYQFWMDCFGMDCLGPKQSKQSIGGTTVSSREEKLLEFPRAVGALIIMFLTVSSYHNFEWKSTRILTNADLGYFAK